MISHRDRTPLRAGPRTIPPTATVVRLDGEIDIFTSPELRERLRRALRDSDGLLVCDLSRVSFVDAGGLAVLVGIQRHARSHGMRFGLTGLRPRMAKLLHVTGLDRSLTVYSDDPHLAYADEPLPIRQTAQRD
ncbi:hypothetical protein Misp01_55170 [Microtetraspora sp. NBRC 13810]|uniref:STAS domain-containing protein n=1 Tax=Microtetraspora sp. NBRC 13810 TaxID=3030990 RepID=UPI0024A600C0|nr:STAS domain-containing protein [Microtetraspora sp. NBRC 13810]GLW10389.1 hypothetical protein Misp01_55170 [Microtetraspora sp. NBRC 13810]